MPSPRLIAVAVLVGMGAIVAAVGGVAGAGASGPSSINASTVRGSLPGATPSKAPRAVFDVRAENRLPGTPGWRISPVRGTAAGLAAFADDVSVRAGQRVPLMVSGQGTVRVRALRIGWYGGAGARQVWQGSVRAQPESGDPGSWQARGWADTTGWPEGDYLLRLDQGDAGHPKASRYLPLTVRSASARGRILVLTSPLSWQAENSAGSGSGSANGSGTAGGTGTASAGTASGTGLATGSASGGHSASFDRPYAAGYGSGGFLTDDEAIVELAERSGKRLAYATDYDVARNPALLTGAAAVLVGGDSPYWTASLRTAVKQASDAGTNLAFFGSGIGSRLVSVTNSRTLAVPEHSPSSSVRVTGLRPSCPAGATAPAAGWTVSNADWWGYQGTGVHTGSILPGLVAGGADRAASTAPGSPAALQVLSFGQISCQLAGGGQQTAVQSAGYQVRPSQAGVFTAGTGRWACIAVDTCLDQDGKLIGTDGRSQRFVVQVTRNVIAAFATSGAGRRYPAHGSVQLYAALR